MSLKLKTEFMEAVSVQITNATGSDWIADQVVDVSDSEQGICHGAIANGSAGTVIRLGRFELSKDSGTMAVGDSLYWDKTNNRVSTQAVGNYVGKCAEASTASETTTLVDLNSASNISSDMIVLEDDFLGYAEPFTGIWKNVDVGDATEGLVAGEHGGAMGLVLASTSEAEDAVAYFGDNLCLDIDKLKTVHFRASIATPGIGVCVVLGMGGNHNLDKDTMAQNAWFRLDASLALKCESDDGTNDNDDKATGITLTTATMYDFKIDFTTSADVRFYVKTSGSTTWTRVCTTVTFDMSNYTGNLQPYFSLDKASGTGECTVKVDFIKIKAER